MENESGTVSPVLRYSNAFEYRDKLESTKFIKTQAIRTDRNDSSNKFVPKVQSKPSILSSTRKSSTNMIGVFLDRKIKNEIIKKV